MVDRVELPSRTIGDIDLTGATPVFAVDLDRQAAIADPTPEASLDATAARLARVERLLEADLAALGPSVVTASIEEITNRLDSVARHVDAVSARWDDAERQLAAQLGAHLEGRLDGIDRRLDRLTRIVEAATEPEPEGTVSPTDAALAAVVARLDALTAEVSRLAAIADRVDDPR